MDERLSGKGLNTMEIMKSLFHLSTSISFITRRNKNILESQVDFLAAS